MKNASQNYIIGRHAFAKISEVEGIFLTKEMNKDFRAFDNKKLSNKNRRQAITRKYAH